MFLKIFKLNKFIFAKNIIKNISYMKFTEEQAREALRAELTNKGRKSLAMSEKTLVKQTEILINKLANDEMGLPDFVEVALEILNVTNDNIRKDKSDFVKQWRDEHPEKTPAPEPNQEPKTNNPELDALKAEIEALKATNAENEKKSKLSAKKSDLISALNSKGIKDKEWIDSFLSEVNITEDLDVDAKADIYAKIYNKTQANVSPTITPKNPSGVQDDNLAALKEASRLAEQRNKDMGI